MTWKEPVEPIEPDRPTGMIQMMITLERPPPEEVEKYNRAEKYRALRGNSTQLRDDLIAWLKEEGLWEEVAEIGEATAFNVLFIVCTHRVARELPRAPGVVSATPSDDFRVELLDSTDRSEQSGDEREYPDRYPLE